MWYVCDVLYVCVCCSVVRGCAVSRRYIDVCYCDMFSVVNVYRNHLKFCVVCCAISCPLWSSVYEFQRVECAFTSPVRTECGMFVM